MCLFAWLLQLPSALQAQPRGASQQEPPGYRAAIGAGIEEFDLNHFTEAREHFARAHALFANARTLRGLGLCDFELRRYVQAVQYLEQALAAQVKQLDGKLRKDTEAILVRAQGYVGKLRVQVEPADAVVTLDSAALAPAADGSVLLEVGDHVLEVRAVGHVTERRELQVRGGQDEQVEVRLATVELAPQAVAEAATKPAPLPADDVPPTQKTPIYKRWWLWTIVGVVVVGAAVGTALALTRDKTTTYEPTAGPNTPSGVSLQPLGAR